MTKERRATGSTRRATRPRNSPIAARSPLFFALGALLSLSCAQTGSSPSAAGQKARFDPERASETLKQPSLPMPRGREVSFEAELHRVSEIRGLSPRGPLRGLEVEHDELLSHVTRAVELEMPEKVLIGTEAMLVGLGLVPQGFNYRKTMLALLSAKLAGLYDPHLNAMLIRSGLSAADRQMTLLHELVHALQDQHYDVMEVVKWAPDDTDRSGALSALAEGDATSAMFDGMMNDGKTALSLPPGFIQERMRADSDAPDGVPSIIHRSLKASYIDGLTFVHELRQRGGFEAVDEVWRRPPQTTEQVLHLHKYDVGEAPLLVPVPSAPSKDFELLLHDSWGEQNLRLVFEEWLPLEKATTAAAGWGGDRIVAYRSQTATIIIWHLVADDEAGALRYFTAFSEGYLEGRQDLGSKEQTCGRRALGSPLVGIVRSGRHVILGGSPVGMEGTPGEQCLASVGYMLTQI